MAQLVGISGSVREASLNSALLRAAAEVLPDGHHLDIRSIRGIPIYDGDLEAEHGVPDPVTALKDAIAASDGLIIATPEYNNSIPGPLKNAIDWLTRPPADIARVFRNRPVALMGASPGGFGTTLGQAAWLPVLRTLRADFWSEGRLLVSRAKGAFDDHGRLIDDNVRDQLDEFMQAFAAYAASRSAARS
ncbi:NADPH-dependent FMN reductase [Roseitranquillus sediminis]|uniref:NADPH-dependent FMN reductase n=1 Tax=Roseitranquillus sediminis TaxID=2809051 RepID=UPI001D0C1DEB|nr:NADPH-dependent FMN reductase [Roseitranquillus sediminis]MBM9593021.1 NAD(P)H-dependent oxidoreductase [Roseitranquillus sediminis]